MTRDTTLTAAGGSAPLSLILTVVSSVLQTCNHRKFGGKLISLLELNSSLALLHPYSPHTPLPPPIVSCLSVQYLLRLWCNQWSARKAGNQETRVQSQVSTVSIVSIMSTVSTPLVSSVATKYEINNNSPHARPLSRTRPLGGHRERTEEDCIL